MGVTEGLRGFQGVFGGVTGAFSGISEGVRGDTGGFNRSTIFNPLTPSDLFIGH